MKNAGGTVRQAKRRLSVFGTVAMLLLLMAGGAVDAAVQVEVSSTLNPVGSGARATGMGGAFISVADDATAASWNPAGLVQLERPEVSAVYSYFNRSQTYHSGAHPEVETTNSMDANGLNYASAAYPFVFLKRNMIVSLNYQRLYEMTKKLNFRLTQDVQGEKLYNDVSFVQKGYLYALSPAFAIQVSPKLFVGATVNFWGDYLGHNGWNISSHEYATANFHGVDYKGMLSLTNRTSFSGTNAHFGMLWNFYGPLTLGAVYKTAFDGKMRQEESVSEEEEMAGKTIPPSYTTSSHDMTLKMPESYGIGISYRHSDAWNIALDIYRTAWSRFVLVDEEGREKNPIDTKPIAEGRLKDTTQVRLGTEYLIIKDNYVIPLRGGLFYDPEPTKIGSDDYYGFSLGTGLSKKRFSVDASYQFRFGRKVSSDLPGVSGGVNADNNQHTIMMSVIYYF